METVLWIEIKINFINQLDKIWLVKKYRAFHGFGQAKFPNNGLILGSSQFSLLPQLPQLPQLPPKILLDSKVVKIDPKIIISLH